MPWDWLTLTLRVNPINHSVGSILKQVADSHSYRYYFLWPAAGVILEIHSKNIFFFFFNNRWLTIIQQTEYSTVKAPYIYEGRANTINN